jgi:hypothetical protein
MGIKSGPGERSGGVVEDHADLSAAEGEMIRIKFEIGGEIGAVG